MKMVSSDRPSCLFLAHIFLYGLEGFVIQPVGVFKGMLGELFAALGTTNVGHFLTAVDADGTETNISLFSDSGLNEIRRRAQIVADHSKGIEVRLLLGFYSHKAEHVNGLSVKFGDGDLASFNVPAISATGGGNPETRAAFFQHTKHLIHGSQVLLLLYRLSLGIGIDVLFAVNAQEVAAHGEGAVYSIHNNGIGTAVQILLSVLCCESRKLESKISDSM